MSQPITRRKLLMTGASAVIAGAPFINMTSARAATKLTFLMNWFAEAEHGGFFQAKALGLYDKAGIDVELKQGGPQLNPVQLMLGGEADVILSYDLQVLGGVEKGLPLKAIAASFQTDIQGLMVRPNIKKLADLTGTGTKVFIANSGYTSYWPWLKSKFGYTDAMAAPKGIGLQAFVADPTSAAAGYITSEPYTAQQNNIPVNFLLFSDEGWPAYTNPLVTSEAFIGSKRELITPFLQATMDGWKSYLSDPAAGNALIKSVNPKMDDGQIAFSLARMKQTNCVASGDAKTRGIGTMSEERWKRTRDLMVASNLLKADTDWKKAFTTTFIDNVKVII